MGAFIEFEAKYREMDFLAIFAEVATWPDDIPLNQGLAAMVRLIDLACDDERTPDEQKLQAAKLAATCEGMLRLSLSREGNEANLLAFEKALAATHDGIMCFALYPEIAKMIVSGAFKDKVA
ncbi:MAG: hypothetical protein ACLQFI_02310 [Methylocella sp.]